MPETATPPAILVVDDTPENLAVLGGLLQPRYRVQVANSGTRALAIAARAPHPDLILLDVMMPEMDGYTVLDRLRGDPATRDIPVIFVTALDADEDEERGLALGAVDYITKPIRPAIVLARVKAHLELKQARDWLADKNAWLESEIARRMRENLLIQDTSIRSLASLAEMRDMETGHHIRRTQGYVGVIAEHLSRHPRFAGCLTPAMSQLITKAAPLHDIGKVGIPDAILLKPGRLDGEELTIMRRHSQFGSDAIDMALRSETSEEEYALLQGHCALDGHDPAQAIREFERAPLAFLAVAKAIARWHHEKWDGSGYPDGLAGEAIPIPARIMAVADVFDALASRRVYKPPMSVEESVRIIREGSGSHFDPAVVEAFLANQDTCVEILRRFDDDEATLAHKLDSMRAQGMI
ncbi:MAG: two-component system response regulator [Pseudomonadota bacterium]